jgi:hypothetical protein
MEFKRGEKVTDGLLTGIVCKPKTYIDDELRTVIVLSKSKQHIDLDPSTLTKIKKDDEEQWW